MLFLVVRSPRLSLVANLEHRYCGPLPRYLSLVYVLFLSTLHVHIGLPGRLAILDDGALLYSKIKFILFIHGVASGQAGRILARPLLHRLNVMCTF